MLSTSAKAWERQPGETETAWAAFMAYREMPIFGEPDQTRSLRNLASKLGYNSLSTIEGWSAKNDWQERVAAYDSHLGSTALSVREVAIEQYQKNLVATLTTNLAALQVIIQRRMKLMGEALDLEVPVNPLDIQRLAAAIRITDDLGRRAAGMPTNYTTEHVEEEDLEERIFTIGGN